MKGLSLRRMAAAAFLLVALLGLSLGSVAIRGHVDELTGLFGGDLRVAVLEAIDLNPFTATNDASWNAISVVYDSIARIGADLVTVPWAATGWTIDGDTLRVTLRDNLVFADGHPFSAHDIVFSYNIYSGMGLLPADLTVEGTGTLVNITSATGGGLLFEGLTLPIVKNGTGETNAPVGSGPFTPMTTTMPVTLDRNDHHFAVPKLATITYSLHADTGAASVALIRGDIDFIGSLLTATDPTNIIIVDGRNTSLLGESDKIAVVTNPGLSQFFLGIDTTDPILGEAVLRQAIAHALNKELFLQIQPSVVGTSSLVASANVPWFNGSVPRYDAGFVLVAGRSTVNVATSNSILDQADYLDADGDGWRDTPAGQAMTFTALAPTFDEDIRLAAIADAFQTAMSLAGLNIGVSFANETTRDQALAAGTFDMVFDTMATGQNPSFISSNFWITRFDDAELNAMLAASDAAIDNGQRQALVKDALGMIGERVPLAPIFFFDTIEAYNNTQLEGWVSMLGGVNNFWSLIGLHPTSVGSLSADVTVVPVSARSGDAVTALVRVVDQDGAGLADADVVLLMGGASVATGTTDAVGSASLSFSAPSVSGATDVALTLEVSKMGYVGDRVTASITVRPDTGILVVSVASDTVSIGPDDTASITVTVRDGTGASVAGAQVSLAVGGTGGVLGSKSGATGSGGTFITSFTADVGVRTQFRISVTASLAGFEDGAGSTSVFGEQRVGSVEPRVSPFFDIGAIIAAVVLLVVLAAVIWWTRR